MSNPSENARILIVDDTPKNIQVLGMILKEANYLINVAQNGQQALESVKIISPDLILLDIMMPVMDGFETCAKLKADPATADIPVIFLTAKTEAEDIVKGFELGAVDYLTKPFNGAELFVRVESHLTRLRLQREVEQRLAEIESLKREQETFISHELTSRVERLEEAVRQQATDQIAEGVEGLSGLVRTLRGLMSFGKGEYQLQKEEVQLDQLIRGVIGDLEIAYGTLANVLYQNQLTNPMVPADRDLLSGVVHDLVKKAIEEVAGHAESSYRVVTVNVSEAGETVVIRVLHKAEEGSTDPFASLRDEPGGGDDEAVAGSSLGSGYGLLVARAHGGNFTIDVDNQGTATTTLTLSR